MTFRHDYRSITAYKAKLHTRIKALDPKLAGAMNDLKLPWYYIKNVTDTDASDGGANTGPGTEVFIYDEIGGSFGVSAIEFVEDIGKIKDDAFTVRINSPGGSVFDAVAIYNALIQHPATVKTRVDAIAASAASIIAMAADPRDEKTGNGGVEMMVGSQLMIHDAMGVEMGNAKDMREMATFLDRQSDNLASIYANKGGDKQDWRALMLAETWMFAHEAVDFGLADSVFTRAVEREKPELLEEEPGKETEEATEEEDQDEGEDQSPDEEIDDFLEALMHREHRLTARGYKYTGRDRAPAPRASKNAHKMSKASTGLADLVSNWR